MLQAFLNDLAFRDLSGELIALVQVLMIDLVLAGDNAVAVGLSAAGLNHKDRRRVIIAGLALAVVLRVTFAVIATRLLGVIGLSLAGGLILLWVCWKMWSELHAHAKHAKAHAAHVKAGGAEEHAPAPPAKSFAAALLQITLADLSMSLDNVLAVAGAAREHPAVLVFGLMLSIALMGIAATWIAKLLHKQRWIGFVGLLVVVYVACHMIWDGHRGLVIDLGRTQEYNQIAPAGFNITPAEIKRHKAHKD